MPCPVSTSPYENFVTISSGFDRLLPCVSSVFLEIRDDHFFGGEPRGLPATCAPAKTEIVSGSTVGSILPIHLLPYL